MPDGPPCPGNCPNSGCVEAYCSGQALERDATELARDKPGSRLAAALDKDGRVDARELVTAAEEGDRTPSCCSAASPACWGWRSRAT